MTSIKKIFGVEKPIIGMVHIPPLPGSPRFEGNMSSVINKAKKDANSLAQGGIDGIMVENLGDNPWFKSEIPKETLSAITLVAKVVNDEVDIPVGMNVLRNAAETALAISRVIGGKYIRVNVLTDALVTDQGIIEGCAADLIRYRKELDSKDIKIFADIHSKHAAPLSERPLEEVAKDCVERGMADALIVTGPRSGSAAKKEDIKNTKNAVPKTPVIVGSGINRENLETALKYADGAIVGTSLKKEGEIENPVDLDRVKGLMKKARELRQS